MKTKSTSNKQPLNDGSIEAVMNELVKRGYHEPAQKRKSFRLARQLLQASPVTANAFIAAMNAIQTHPERIGSWRELIESAYACLVE